jgi:hypothetical protein
MMASINQTSSTFDLEVLHEIHVAGEHLTRASEVNGWALVVEEEVYLVSVHLGHIDEPLLVAPEIDQRDRVLELLLNDCDI